jgi:transcriptional regulator with XRE-family HTH domain
MRTRPPTPTNRIRELREQAGMTQEVLAKRIGSGWTKLRISRLETGATSLRAEQMPAFAKAFEVSQADLLPQEAGKTGHGEALRELLTFLDEWQTKHDLRPSERVSLLYGAAGGPRTKPNGSQR